MPVAAPQGLSRPSKAAPYVATAVALSLIALGAIRLSGFASTAIFGVDECWHALVARIMAVSGGWVTTTTDMMRGTFHMDYPPLFHLIGAGVYLFAGPQSWPYLNLAIAALLLGTIVLGRDSLVGPVERSGVALTLVATPLFAMYSVRFYTEMLTAAVFFVSWWWLALVLRDARRRDAIVSGIATGLFVWTKQTGLLVLGLYGVIWAWIMIVGPGSTRRAMTWLVAIATLFAVAFLGLMWGRGENPLLFAMPTSHPEVWSAAMGAGVRVPHGIFFDTLRSTWGILPFILLLLPFVAVGIRGWRDYPYFIHLLLAAVLIAVFLIDRRLVERHTLFLVPLIAFLGVDALARLGRPALLAGCAAIAVFAAVHVATMPNYRVNFNPSRNFAEMMRVISTTTAPDATIATVWWVEVRYHTGRNVLWPLPHLDDPPVELFDAPTADQWYERLRNRRIDYLLVDARYVGEEMGLGYSRPLLAHVPTLVSQGHMALAAARGPLSLYQVF
jgi:4-amino-4-deoxy-L-arabinose transferase-like glycosyltransferase